MSSPPNNASDTQIRARLLNRLGIYDAPATSSSSSSSNNNVHQQPIMTAAQTRRLRILRGMGVGYTLRASPPDGSAPRHPLGNVIPYKDKLRSEPPLSGGLTFGINNSEHSNDSDNDSKKTRHIAFQEEVDVLPIPTRHEYSDRIKGQIWSSRLELQENAERNALEYAAEGWHWQGVTEDEGMYICSVSGELVHPIHLQEHLQSQADGRSDHEGTRGASLERGSPVHSN
jgi:hypothetical protein